MWIMDHCAGVEVLLSTDYMVPAGRCATRNQDWGLQWIYQVVNGEPFGIEPTSDTKDSSCVDSTY
ncbi:hypothetical protein PHMEG_00016731 [Phytophthora megakarya]|uniref:Uncharacterized protein n=1 Tax=Phytophthora megakarya TaxID=4795 RepID=A0A225VY94_9STRA|nr:hypothetical protein PHMEG_00016731 [Phytophthora megakarya]